MLEWRWKLPASSRYSFLMETKRLDLRRNQAFHNASGGDKRDRTADLLNAIQALSQLSLECHSSALPAELYPRRRRIIIEL